VAWWSGEARPLSVFQASIDYTDSDASIDVNLPLSTDAGMLGARANPNRGMVLSGQLSMPGLWWYCESACARRGCARAMLAASVNEAAQL